MREERSRVSVGATKRGAGAEKVGTGGGGGIGMPLSGARSIGSPRPTSAGFRGVGAPELSEADSTVGFAGTEVVVELTLDFVRNGGKVGRFFGEVLVGWKAKGSAVLTRFSYKSFWKEAFLARVGREAWDGGTEAEGM